jgi:hypothetical protein
MEWFYAHEGQKFGPIPPSELENLRRNGVVKADTLLWRDGMADWRPLSQISDLPSGSTPLPGSSGYAHCAECQRMFPKTEMVAFESNFICAACKPTFFQKMREGITPGGAAGTMWRKGRQLVTSLDATLPDRCVKCNAPSDGRRMKRKLSWHHPAIYLTILAGLLIYVIVAVAASKRATVFVCLCAAHRSQRTRNILIVWLLIIGGFAAFILGVSNDSAWIGIAGAVAFVAGLILAFVATRVLIAKRIDKEHAWMTGCCPEFLAEFPEWPGQR